MAKLCHTINVCYKEAQSVRTECVRCKDIKSGVSVDRGCAFPDWKPPSASKKDATRGKYLKRFFVQNKKIKTNVSLFVCLFWLFKLRIQLNLFQP